METYRERRLDADVLVIGGGSAGSMACHRARELDPGQRVVLFEKGDFRYSGSIARGMDALNVVAVPGVSTPELYVESTTIANEKIIDQSPSRLMAERSFGILKKLEKWGVYFPKDADGNYGMLKVHPKGKFLVHMAEPELKRIVSQRAMDAGVTVVNRTMAVELLTDGDRVVGAVGVNVRSGELVVCHARAVILSNGGVARFGLPNSGYLYGTFDFPGNTGDGYAMAYRAGALLTGFEHTLIYPIIKDMNAPLLYIVLTRGGKLLDGLKKELDSTDSNIKNMMMHCFENRGPLSIRMSDLPEDKVREIEEILFSVERPAEQRFFQGRGIDFRRNDIELHPTECFLCGGHGMAGLVVDQKAGTTLPGLFCAGDTASVPRQFLTGAFVFGEVAAENATEFAHRQPPGLVDETQVDAVRRKIQGILQQKGRGIGIREFEYKVRRFINDYLIPPKNETKLTTGLEFMAQFQEQLFQQVEVRGVHDMTKVLENDNIIQCALLSATASLERKESRWGFFHYRTDYPHADNSRWVRHIDLFLSRGSPEVSVAYRDIDNPYAD
ncbi:MAG: FAD-binding protein [Deltaproteobacteria bacterium]|nr:FAD-binding protein [Deltaproteobacteria bacterium]